MRRNGFTMIELLATLALVALVASAALPMAEQAVKRSREAELRHALREIRDALDAHKRAADEGRIPNRLGESGYPANLSVLVSGVPDARRPDGRRIVFLRRIPRDPFADAAVAAVQTWGVRSYESPHDAPRPGQDVYDVHSLSHGTGINGTPYREW